MLEWFIALDPLWQATLAGVFTWSITALGSAVVFFMNNINDTLLAVMNGFAGGVMIAASFWSLLAPAIESAESAGYGRWSFMPALIGFLVGGGFLRLIDKILPHTHLYADKSDEEGAPVSLSSTALLFIAITIHNFPEGLSVGVAFGAIGRAESATLASAVALAIGIGLQNFPEGAALSMPIRAEGNSKSRSFNLGQASALVEIVGAFLGALLVTQVSAIMPYALSFAAGAMVFVVVEDLIPTSQATGKTDIATLAFMVGFAVMMVLDVALG